jgi:EAL domain-containing protein (putative c-di-GMP-specific phosphodiesterase class I)
MESEADPQELPLTDAGGRTTVLLVDDEPVVLRSFERLLRGVGNVVPCSTASTAIERVRQGGIDVVVSDISMPGMSGLDLLREIRSFDQDLPVILATGLPTVETAAGAIEHGVFRYLTKPIHTALLRGTVAQASQLYRLARLKREALDLAGIAGPSDRIGLEVSFDRALASLHVVFQPIVSHSGRSVYGYEALMRTNDPVLPTPADLLNAAEKLDRIFDVGRLVRRWAGELFRTCPDRCLLFMNLHPEDLGDPELFDTGSPLSDIADRVVLEVTERASLGGVTEVAQRIQSLRSRGFRIAVDDLGAGYAGLTSFALLEPDLVKLDMTLTRGIHESAVKQKLVHSMASLCTEMGIATVVEGVESVAERDTVLGLGCDLLQGYLFAQPGRGFPEVRW